MSEEMDFDHDDDFEDLFDEANLLQDSSQESLNEAAANISFADVADDDAPPLARFKDADVGQDNTGQQVPVENNSIRATQESLDQNVAYSSLLILSGQIDRTLPVNSPNVIAQIEDCFEQIVDALLNEKDEVSITLISRKPTSSANDPVVLRILELMHEALRKDVVLSKRDIFYRDPALFGKQTHVDRYVDDIAFTFGTTRSALNITAAAKGLTAGAFNICRRDGCVVDASADREGILVPTARDITSVDMSGVRFILVIEKEATFRSIGASDFWEIIRSKGVILTGKGYPDLASQAMLRLLSSPSPQNGFAAPPVYGLADFDPDGMAIMSIYQHGSRALAHEKEGHCVPQLQRLGLRSKHLFVGDDTQAAQGILALTARDRRKASKLLCDNMDDASWQSELQTMLMFNMKAELQLLDGVPGAVHDLLTGELTLA